MRALLVRGEPRRVLCWLAVVACGLGLGCEPIPERPSEITFADSAPSSPGCPDPGAEAPHITDQTVVLEPVGAFCDIVVVPVVRLEGSLEGSPPVPGRRVVVTSDGRYYTTSGYSQQILEWTADGRFRRAVGSAGEGPGEFSPRGALLLFVGPRDSLFVLDGGQRWTVFDPDLNYVRTFLGRFHGRNDETLHVVEGRGILTTGDLRVGSSESDASFHWMEFDGSPGTSFGPSREVAASGGPREERASAADAGGLWVVPPNGARRGFALERWTYEGRRTRVLERRVPWLPPDGYSEADASGEPHLPEYDLVHLDGEGLLWVMVVVRDLRWRPVSGEERQDLTRELYDGRLEVIDPKAGRVVASYRYDGPPDEVPPLDFLGDGRRAHRVVEDALGLTAIEIFDVHLVQGGG